MDYSMPGLPVFHYFTVCSNSYPLNQSWYLTIISFARFFSFCLHLSQHQSLFQWVNYLHQIAKELELQLQHQSFQWIAGLISFRMDWFDLLAVHGTLQSLLQHHSSKASVLWCSALFRAQLSYPHMTTGKTTVLIRCTFVMPLLFNMPSSFVIAFLPRNKLIIMIDR